MKSLDSWSHENPVRIQFGDGLLGGLDECVVGGSVLIVASPGTTRRGTTDRIRELLGSRDVDVYDDVEPLPDPVRVGALADDLPKNVTSVVGIGGGSVMDVAKLLGLLLADDDIGVEEILEGLPREREYPRIPVITIPTTAGTGAEVTPFATLWDSVAEEKLSVDHPSLFPRTALVDPELSRSMPTGLARTTGLDALCQALESLWARRGNPISRRFAASALRDLLEGLPESVQEEASQIARRSVVRGSLMAGLAISQSRTTLAHSISYSLTMHYDVPHGLACAFTIVQVLEFNAQDGQREWISELEAIGFDGAAALGDELTRILERIGALGRLREMIPDEKSLQSLAGDALTPGRADNNPRPVGQDDVRAILRRAAEALDDG